MTLTISPSFLFNDYLFKIDTTISHYFIFNVCFFNASHICCKLHFTFFFAQHDLPIFLYQIHISYSLQSTNFRYTRLPYVSFPKLATLYHFHMNKIKWKKKSNIYKQMAHTLGNVQNPRSTLNSELEKLSICKLVRKISYIDYSLDRQKKLHQNISTCFCTKNSTIH